MCAVVIMAGDRILDWSGAPQSVGGGTMAVIVGTASTSIFIVATYFVFGILALNAFLFWSVLVLGAIVLDVGANLRTSDWRLDTRDLAALAALAILVAIWSRSQAAALPTLVTAGHLPAWSDSYILGAVVSQIGSPYVAAFGHIGLAGEPLVAYHYAFLALSAVSAGFLDFPSLGIATAMLTPLGLLVMVLGAYQLVSVLSSRTVGLIAVAAVMFLPDASTYGFSNGFFGFHWMAFISPSNGYAIGVVLAATALLTTCISVRARGCLMLAAAMTIAAFEFRAHIFALFLPAIVATLLFESERIWRHRGRAALYLAGVSTVALTTLISVRPLREWWLGFSALEPFLHFIHTGQSPTGYENLYRHLVEAYGPVIAAFVGVSLVPLLAAGLLLPLFAILLAIAVSRGGWRRFDTFPILLLLCYLGIVLFAPTPFTGDFTELKQRPFVLLYVIFLIWCISLLARILPQEAKATLSRPATSVVVVCAAAFLGYWGSASPAAPRMAWAKGFYDLPITPGLVATAQYVRPRRSLGDVFVFLPPDPQADLHDPAIQFASLVDLPAYVARPVMHRLWGEPWSGVAQSRVEQITAISKMTRMEEVYAAMDRLGIAWGITIGADNPTFDQDGSRAEFRSGSISLYHIGRARDVKPKN